MCVVWNGTKEIKSKSHSYYPAKPRVYWIFVTKLMVGGVNFFGYKTEVVMRIAIAELLAFAYNLE